MSAFDRFLSVINLNDDDDEDDYFDDDDIEVDDSAPGRRLIRRDDDTDDDFDERPGRSLKGIPERSAQKQTPKKKKETGSKISRPSAFRSGEEETDADSADGRAGTASGAAGKKKSGLFSSFRRKPEHEEFDDDGGDEEDDGSISQSYSSKVSAFRPRREAEDSQTNNFSVCVIRPRSMEDALEIAKTLLKDSVVILNLEGLDLDVSQRIFDFASGACCALMGKLDKISNYIFVLTPKDIDISGEFQEILTGAFDDDLDDEEEY